ncbi:MAG: diaminopimelate dehydrogenase [Oscillospiraceae bacterium]|nr:diaminopimelate dehydrogenase [Oscillospiraceae bacterium]
MIRAAVISFGNVGKAVYDAVIAAPDFEAAGIVEPNKVLTETIKEVPVVFGIDEIKKLGKIDVAIIGAPSRAVIDIVPQYLAEGINTVDSFDIHGSVWETKTKFDICAKQNGVVSVLSTGFDPGLDSLVRTLFEAAAPRGKTYTNFGPGMSMGHTVAVKSIEGVKNALSLTIPAGAGIHRRMVYIELENGYDFDEVSKKIKSDPYFVNDETYVSLETDVNNIIDMGSGVNMTRKGVSGRTHNQNFEFNMKINNPALTGQFMVSSARAALKQKPGCYTAVEIPAVDFLYGEKEDLIRRLV